MEKKPLIRKIDIAINNKGNTQMTKKKVIPINKRNVRDAYKGTHSTLRNHLGYLRYLDKQKPNALTKDFCDAIRLIAQAESKLAKTLTTIELQEAA